MKSTYRLGTAGLAVAFFGFSLSAAEGGHPGRRRARFAAPQRPAVTRPNELGPNALGPNESRQSRGISTYSPYGMWMEGYPKYYGGFHARYFDEMLYPTGDRPVRGTAW